ncbi:Alpha/Beta hydrolase protein [Hysterangium stoloniferum]|nr:Alpha/Beta hydrolase protein [Hysterangium stoloniferum]
MVTRTLYVLLASLIISSFAQLHTVRPFDADLTRDAPRMLRLVKDTRLPPTLSALMTVSSTDPGVDAQWIRKLKKEWIHGFDWNERQEYINSFNHFKVEIEGLDIHFIHAKSTAASTSDVIPIILTHGWPGSFLEFLPVVQTLTQLTTLPSGRNISFDVIIPSLPGFAYSSPPPPVWTVNDTARVWNTLMTDVLKYTSGYSIAGTDWGALVNWCLLNEYPLAKAAHFNFLAIVPPSIESLIALGAEVNDFERLGLENAGIFFHTGIAYFNVHQTRPWTLGLALSDNPMGQLSWIAEKYRDWSDPSRVDITYILTTVSLYYLTGSFPTSLYIYAQNSGFSPGDVKAITPKPFGYSSFQWEGIFSRHPKSFIDALGNLTYYKEHYHGGHFAPSEVPAVYGEDIIEMMAGSYPL